MAFQVRHKLANGTYAVATLRPHPTDVEYPKRYDYETVASEDGAVTVDRPLHDSRERRWIWKAYRETVPGYTDLWTLLQSFDARTRAKAGLEPTVQIWEDESGIGGFDRMSGDDRVYTVVKILLTDRTLRPGGGPPIYDETFLSFVVIDSTYQWHR